MKEVVLQVDNKTLVPFSEADEEAIKEFKQNQPIRAKLYGVQKPRSYQQLKTYWGGCNVVSDNLENMTPEEVDFEVKVRLKHIKQFRIVNGVTIVEVDSISYARLPHLTACRYFDRAFPVLAGMPSPSCFDQIITTKGEPSKQREKYLYKLAGEAVAGIREDDYTSFAMQRGTEMEAEAKAFYEFTTGQTIQEVGFVKNDICGGSPDGLIGDDGIIEIKCPLVNTHVEYLLNNKMPTTYFQQVQGYLFITGRSWLDLMSYYPGLKPLVVRVQPDKAFHKSLEVELIKFNRELKEIIKAIS